MEKHFEWSDAEFERQFQTGALSPAVFSHEAHLRLAWIHIRHYGVQQAIENICFQLKAYVQQLGAAGKFNKTVTVAAVKAVNHFMLKSYADNFYDFIHEFPRLKYNFKDLMAFHYQTDIYNNQKAKTEFLEPDLLPFD